jgi:hypothetical protein
LAGIIGIANTGTEIPVDYLLYQNYPNPFNPSTRIKFDVSRSSFVSLKIFDVLGREVAILVNEDITPGTYKVDWDAAALPSGVYFCRLQTKSFNTARKMILLK